MSDFIVTWEFYKGKEPPADVFIRRLAITKGVDLSGQMKMAESPILHPIVNHGVWMVLCPFCAGAELAREDEKFMCQSCYNGSIARKQIMAPFPVNRQEIEWELLKRSSPDNRNWIDETIEQLQQENQEHEVK